MNHLPSWTIEPFWDFLHSAEELRHMLTLSIHGVSQLHHRPTPLEAEVFAHTTMNGNYRSTPLKEEETLLAREVSAGFPYLHAQAVTLLWSLLETLHRELIKNWLLYEPSAMKVPALRDIRIGLADYSQRNEEERAYYLIDELERTTSGRKHGVLHFERLLELFDLRPAVRDEDRLHLVELSLIRDALVLRRGRADQMLVEFCPWLDLSLGDRIVVTDQDYDRYATAGMNYAQQLVHAVGRFHGITFSLNVEQELRRDPAAER